MFPKYHNLVKVAFNKDFTQQDGNNEMEKLVFKIHSERLDENAAERAKKKAQRDSKGTRVNKRKTSLIDDKAAEDNDSNDDSQSEQSKRSKTDWRLLLVTRSWLKFYSCLTRFPVNIWQRSSIFFERSLVWKCLAVVLICWWAGKAWFELGASFETAILYRRRFSRFPHKI